MGPSSKLSFLYRFRFAAFFVNIIEMAARGQATESALQGSKPSDVSFRFSNSASVINLEAAAADNALLGQLRGVDTPQSGPIAPDLVTICLPLIRMGYANMVDDSFTRCFKSKKRVPWNWNPYLFVAWSLGLFLRYMILFPLRLFALTLGFVFVLTLFPLVKLASPVMSRATTKQAETW